MYQSRPAVSGGHGAFLQHERADLLDRRQFPAPRQHVAVRLPTFVGSGDVVVPDRHDPIARGIRQHRAHDELRACMEAGYDRDADRQRDCRYQRQPRILEQQPDAQFEVQPAAAHPRQSLCGTGRFAQLRQPSQLHEGHAASLLRRQAATLVVGGQQIEMRLDLFVEPLVRSTAPERRDDALKQRSHYDSSSSSRDIIATVRDHRSASTDNCFFPARVIV